MVTQELERANQMDGIINVKKDFVFINILNIVKSINFEGISPIKLGELTRNNDLYFYEEAGENILFRDALYTNMLYCTKEVENILNELDIKGLALKKVGKVAPLPVFPKERNIFNKCSIYNRSSFYRTIYSRRK